jgi:hypothetical protein
MTLRGVSLMLAISVMASGCASPPGAVHEMKELIDPTETDWYPRPGPGEYEASIQDDYWVEDVWGKDEFVFVVSIDRRVITTTGRGLPAEKPEEDPNRFENTIALNAGVQRMHLRACKRGRNRIGFAGFYCTDRLVKLDALPDHRYRARALVNRQDDYADIWVEDLDSGEDVVEPVRLSELEWYLCGFGDSFWGGYPCPWPEYFP